MDTSGTHAAGATLQGAARDAFVRDLFHGIAEPYDRLNRIISFGRDRAARRRAVDLAAPAPGVTAVDLGTGTGDLALLLALAAGPGGAVYAIDAAPAMLGVAARKLDLAARQAPGRLAPVTFREGHAARTGLTDAFADVVLMGWVLRNVGDRPAIYAEVLRILRPGGRFIVLEMSRPRSLWRRLAAAPWLHLGMPLVASLCGGSFRAYRYLARSTAIFPPADALAAELADAGFGEVTWETALFGNLAIHRAVR